MDLDEVAGEAIGCLLLKWVILVVLLILIGWFVWICVA